MRTSTDTTKGDLLNYISPYKSRENIRFECPHCDSEFFRTKKYVQERLHQLDTGHKSNPEIFCSSSCSKQYRDVLAGRDLVEVECLECKTKFRKHRCQIGKTTNNFCTRACANSYSSRNKTNGARRSKLEIWLEDEVSSNYPELEIHFNRKDTINSELDIYFPSLKLAFEINGIFHYEPIYGAEKLKSIQNNDDRKFQACLERGIELCIIDSASQVRFKKEKSRKYLKIITDLVDKKIGDLSIT
jgi:hypothetical protein